MAVRSGKTIPTPPDDVVDFGPGADVPGPRHRTEMFLLHGAPPQAEAVPRGALDLSGVAVFDWSAALDIAPEESGDPLIRIDEAVPAR